MIGEFIKLRDHTPRNRTQTRAGILNAVGRLIPRSGLKEVGVKIMSHGEAIYAYPDGMFTYGKFVLRSIEYNCR